MFIFSSISSGLEFGKANHALINENSELNLFKNTKTFR